MKKRVVPGMCLAVMIFTGACAGAEDTTDTTEQRMEDQLPVSFDSREWRKVPPVRNQAAEQTCWAITAASVLEASMEPEAAIAFSSDHIVEQNAYQTDPDDGGDFLMLMAYLSGWQGPVAEDEISADAAVHVQDIELIPQDVWEIKRSIRQYGAVQSSLYMRKAMTEDPAYYQKESAAYYCPQDMAVNHDVMVIGWDDTFPAGEFGTDPGMDGAFLCQNTWGTSFGQDGLFYVSYADANFGKVALAYTRIDPPDRYDRIYQTDDYGWRDRQGFDDEMCWFANAYQTESEEILKAVGFYSVGPDTDYEIYLARGAENPDAFSDRELLQVGHFSHAGYHTVDLEQEIRLEENTSFAVIIKICTPGSETPVAVEYAWDERTRNVILDHKFGYLSQTGESWHHTEERYQTNVCLKAYTCQIK